jgi:predicted DNA-binding transcriptional regulator AlpA
MQNIETLTTDDLMRDLKMSRSTLYRHVKEARAGRGGNFPLPIQMGPKKSLRWDAETVRKFLQNGNDTPPTAPMLKNSSAKSIRVRHTEAMNKLEKKGIRLKRQEG